MRTVLRDSKVLDPLMWLRHKPQRDILLSSLGQWGVKHWCQQGRCDQRDSVIIPVLKEAGRALSVFRLALENIPSNVPQVID